MKKKVVSCLLIGMMAVGMLAGCGNSEEASTTTGGSADVSEADEEEETGFDEMQTIEMYGLALQGDDGIEEVIDAINEISEKEINVHVNYTAMDISTYMQQMTLKLSGGENFDLMMVTSIPSVSFSTLTAQNQLMDITEYLDEYASETYEMMSDYLPATTVDGSVYAIPCYRQYDSSAYIMMRKDVLEELGLTETAQNITSWTEFEDILKQVNDAQDSLPDDLKTTVMIANNDTQGTVINIGNSDVAADSFADCYGYDSLGDTSKLIYANTETNTVESAFAREDYLTMVSRVHDWYEEGLVYKDAATDEQGVYVLMQNGVTFSSCITCEYGIEAVKPAEVGHDVVCIDVADIPIQTTAVTSWGWAVPTTSKNPEAAVAFMNLMWTNEEIENLFVYGIEGRDYELNEEGEAVILDDGVYQSSDFFYGNQFNAYPQENTGGDFRERALEHMNEAEISPYFGCVVTTDPITNELTAISNVLSQYEPGLESGASDPAMVDEMNAALEEAGLQTVLDYYQSCLDEWLAEQ